MSTLGSAVNRGRSGKQNSVRYLTVADMKCVSVGAYIGDALFLS